MSNPFWPQELQFQSDQKISKHIRKHLYIPMFSSHSGSLGHLRSKKIWIIAKNHSIESSSNKDSKCNLLLQITTENLQKLADATITFVLQVKFATRLQLWTWDTFPHFIHTDTFICWVTLSSLQSNLSLRTGPLILFHHNTKQLTT